MRSKCKDYGRLDIRKFSIEIDKVFWICEESTHKGLHIYGGLETSRLYGSPDEHKILTRDRIGAMQWIRTTVADSGSVGKRAKP